MSAALPRPARPSLGPPNSALPALPMAKTRKSTGTLQAPASRSTSSTPKPSLRAPSSAFLPPPSPAPTGALPQPRSASGLMPAGKTIRKVVSINSFPQPPRGEGRIASLPPSPLSNGLAARKAKTPTTPTYQFSNVTPSLLNGSGEGKSVARLVGTRNSDGLISVSSPPQSRSSSAQDSYSTSATQYEELEGTQQRSDGTSAKRSSKVDGKGNVLVSVRVRPDAGSGEKPDGEWAVDARKSLISYNGKEGGDYYYGKMTRGFELGYVAYSLVR